MYFDHYDIESESMMAIASSLTIQQKMYWPQIRRGIRERCEMFRSGRSHAPQWIRRELKALDPYLDIRWDFLGQQWLIERYSRRDRAWITVLEWRDHLDGRILNTLHEADTWRFPTSEAYLAHKRAKSAAIRDRNRKAGDERVKEAIDGLTRKRVENFVEVERALQTGETVILAGEAEKQAEQMYEGSKRAAQQNALIDDSKIMVRKPSQLKGT